MIEDSSVDFVFSWDSLVHCESDVMYAYLNALARKMRPHGVGFLHHSHIGAYRNRETGELSVENKHGRGETMSAELFRKYCKDVGLQPVAQEIIGWGGTVLTDCFSVFINRENSVTETCIYENPDFMREALTLKKISQLYPRVSSSTSRMPRRQSFWQRSAMTKWAWLIIKVLSLDTRERRQL
jgi:hypothetical protein